MNTSLPEGCRAEIRTRIINSRGERFFTEFRDLYLLFTATARITCADCKLSKTTTGEGRPTEFRAENDAKGKVIQQARPYCQALRQKRR